MAQSLNSSDVFVLHDSSVCYIWVGKGSIGDELQAAKQVVEDIGKLDNRVLLMEAEEARQKKDFEDFWNLLGGKADYGSAKQIWVSLLILLFVVF